MASQLVRLAVLSCTIAGGVTASRWPWSSAHDRGAQEDWSPARETVTDSLDPLGWTPKPTPAPSKQKLELKLELELRQNRIDDDDDDDSDENDNNDDDEDNNDEFSNYPRTCASLLRAGALFPGKDVVTCGSGSFCTADDRAERVGCCRVEDAGDCSIPTACVGVSSSSSGVSSSSGTTFW